MGGLPHECRVLWHVGVSKLGHILFILWRCSWTEELSSTTIHHTLFFLLYTPLGCHRVSDRGVVCDTWDYFISSTIEVTWPSHRLPSDSPNQLTGILLHVTHRIPLPQTDCAKNGSARRWLSPRPRQTTMLCYFPNWTPYDCRNNTEIVSEEQINVLFLIVFVLSTVSSVRPLVHDHLIRSKHLFFSAKRQTPQVWTFIRKQKKSTTINSYQPYY